MTKPEKAFALPSVVLSYQLIRNTTSPDEEKTGVRSFIANLPALEIRKLGTAGNLRTYIAEHDPRKRNRVHESIENTIMNEPERFITRNSGFVLTASDVEIEDGKKTLRLTNASLINGAQSQGEIERWFKQTFTDDDVEIDTVPFYVRAEIIVDSDTDQVVETAIARNTASPVKSISQAGARKHLDDLEESVAAVHSSLKIRKSETDLGEEFFDTRKILQYARLLMPLDVAENESAAEKLKPYKNPEQCLTEFSEWWEQYETDEKARRKYDFTVQIAPIAISEYTYWEKHPDWKGENLWEKTKKGGRACRRDAAGNISWVSPGLVFPIMGAMSEFISECDGKWKLQKPVIFRSKELIQSAVKQFRGKQSDPYQMGRDSGVYDALRIYPRTLVEVMKAVKS